MNSKDEKIPVRVAIKRVGTHVIIEINKDIARAEYIHKRIASYKVNPRINLAASASQTTSASNLVEIVKTLLKNQANHSEELKAYMTQEQRQSIESFKSSRFYKGFAVRNYHKDFFKNSEILALLEIAELINIAFYKQYLDELKDVQGLKSDLSSSALAPFILSQARRALIEIEDLYWIWRSTNSAIFGEYANEIASLVKAELDIYMDEKWNVIENLADKDSKCLEKIQKLADKGYKGCLKGVEAGLCTPDASAIVFYKAVSELIATSLAV